MFKLLEDIAMNYPDGIIMIPKGTVMREFQEEDPWDFISDEEFQDILDAVATGKPLSTQEQWYYDDYMRRKKEEERSQRTKDLDPELDFSF